MPEHMKFSGGQSFAEWFVIHAITELPKEKQDELNSKVGYTNQVCLTFDGIELPVRETLDYIGKKFDECVLNEAKELFKKEFDKLSDPLYDKVRELNELFDDIIGQMQKKLGIPKREER
jgi:hypothetical protein